jgi:hypothetical protein
MERKHLKIPFSAHVRFGEGHPSRDEGFAPTPNAVDEMHVGFVSCNSHRYQSHYR